MSGRVARMEELLRAAFAPAALEINDQSRRHAHHTGTRMGGAPDVGETHYHMVMVSPAFEGRSRVERQRAVHAALAGEFATGLHALSLVLRTPAEAKALAEAAGGRK